MTAAVENDKDARTGLGGATPVQLAGALAWKSAAYGARQTGKAVRQLPRFATRARRTLPSGPLARAAERNFSFWSTESRSSIASIRSHASAWSIYSMFSGGSVGSIGSIGSVLSVGSAGSLLSIGSAGSILSIGAAGSVLSIGGVNQQPWNREPPTGEAGDELSLTVVEHGGTLLGVLALAAAGRSALSAS